MSSAKSKSSTSGKKKSSKAVENKKNGDAMLNKYEIARIIGARALQIASGAPFFVEMSEEELKAINYNPVAIAEKELEEGMIPIAIKRE